MLICLVWKCNSHQYTIIRYSKYQLLLPDFTWTNMWNQWHFYFLLKLSPPQIQGEVWKNKQAIEYSHRQIFELAWDMNGPATKNYEENNESVAYYLIPHFLDNVETPLPWGQRSVTASPLKTVIKFLHKGNMLDYLRSDVCLYGE